MLLGRLRALAIAITAPVPTFAQPANTVTVEPVVSGAPLLGWPGLGVLVLALTVGAVLILRRSDRSSARAVGLVTLLLTAAVAYAGVSNVTISDDECHHVTQKSYPQFDSPDLENQCANPIRIIDLQLNCDASKITAPVPDGAGRACEIGSIIPPGSSCQLPTCSC
jgi:hypothetical protein